MAHFVAKATAYVHEKRTKRNFVDVYKFNSKDLANLNEAMFFPETCFLK